jgi:hypothetical protein
LPLSEDRGGGRGGSAYGGGDDDDEDGEFADYGDYDENEEYADEEDEEDEEEGDYEDEGEDFEEAEPEHPPDGLKIPDLDDEGAYESESDEGAYESDGEEGADDSVGIEGEYLSGAADDAGLAEDPLEYNRGDYDADFGDDPSDPAHGEADIFGSGKEGGNEGSPFPGAPPYGLPPDPEEALEEVRDIFRSLDRGAGSEKKPKTAESPETPKSGTQTDSGNAPGASAVPRPGRPREGGLSAGRLLPAKKPVPVKKSENDEGRTILLTERVEDHPERSAIGRQNPAHLAAAGRREGATRAPRPAAARISANAGGATAGSLRRAAAGERPERVSEEDASGRIVLSGNRRPARASTRVGNSFPPAPDSGRPSGDPVVPRDWSKIRAGDQDGSGTLKVSDLTVDELTEIMERALEKALSRVFSRLKN